MVSLLYTFNTMSSPYTSLNASPMVLACMGRRWAWFEFSLNVFLSCTVAIDNVTVSLRVYTTSYSVMRHLVKLPVQFPYLVNGDN